MAVALALPLGLWMVLGNVVRLSGNVQQSREISVFLKQDVDVARATALADELRGRWKQSAHDPLARFEAAPRLLPRRPPT